MKNEILNQLKHFSILCVEDEDIIRNSIINTLKYYFKDVYEANNGENAYYQYLEHKPDIIISDIEMPILNGIELANKIRKNDINTVIIMLTAYSNEEYLLELINLNINHFINKPINSDNLLNGIIKSLGNKLENNIYFTKELYFDIKNYTLFFKNKEIYLRKKDIDFILLLNTNRNIVLTYDLLEEYLWKEKVMSINALKTFIKEFRHKIPIEILQNIPQIGYKLKI